jgi:hypothetical protein
LHPSRVDQLPLGRVPEIIAGLTPLHFIEAVRMLPRITRMLQQCGARPRLRTFPAVIIRIVTDEKEDNSLQPINIDRFFDLAKSGWAFHGEIRTIGVRTLPD